VHSVDLKKTFGSSVRVWRNRLGISQEELGGRAGLHRTYVSDIERGARNVSLESMEKLAQALNVSVATLFGDPADPRAAEAPAKVIDILLVEDSPSDIDLAVEALGQARFINRIRVATDGEAALQALHSAQPRPSLVLLDLALPKIDGLEVLRAIRADERTRSIPVLILTASTDETDRAKCRQLGASGFILKPVGFFGLAEATPELQFRWALLAPPGGAA
jgi:CheY-like chemotaxis protein/DNA-binding XRE family transcriptional regulator